MKGSLSVSILRYSNLLKLLRFLNTNKFYWVILLYSVPLFITSSALVTIAAPQNISQAIPGANINRPTLNIGSQGERVSELQAALKLLGFYTGAVDGIYNDTTASAVFRFKQAAGLNPDGIVDNLTWQRLFPSQPIVASTVPAPNPAPNPAAVIVPSQATNIRRVNPISEPKPAQPRQATSAREQKTTPTRTKPNRTTPTRTAPTRTKPVRTNPFANSPQKPNLQYTSEGFPILRLGNSGSEVAKLQELLKKQGFLESGIDGDFGPTTETALKAAQRRYDLEADGVAGAATWEILLERSQRQR
ncbi:MAG: peptidoglycan-binding protein [Mojavia pulchra JT2-VF2]|uniref:Peptidoglycan-binding protein n=1 Tax=Mojavia pulchra JT2-VF2 TaxID=287848 RepID=A0A951PWP6_9NOST|nr:peptidoglycan-binding protein [Mojavia pulchra JT2-VF2]